MSAVPTVYCKDPDLPDKLFNFPGLVDHFADIVDMSELSAELSR